MPHELHVFCKFEEATRRATNEESLRGTKTIQGAVFAFLGREPLERQNRGRNHVAQRVYKQVASVAPIESEFHLL